MRVVIKSHTPDALKVIAEAANTCQSSKEPELSVEDQRRIVKNCIMKGHMSVLEHASYTFYVEDISRACSHQLVRYRMATFSQQSQRCLELDDPTFVIPPTIAEHPQAKLAFIKAMNQAWDMYNQLASVVPIEDARFVLPNACTTAITFTMNAHELFHFFEQRLCKTAQWEIRAVAEQMYDMLTNLDPHIFVWAGAPCRYGACPQGEPCKRWGHGKP